MQQLLQHLYQKSSLQEIEVEKLRTLTEHYPYYAVGQFLVAKKLSAVADKDFDNQFQKALVYFHNPLWLEYQLSNDEATESTPLYDDVLTSASSTGAASEMSATSHDLVEEVFLHQETLHGTPEEMLVVQAEASEKVLAENPPGESHEPKKGEVTPVQQPERFSFQAYHTVDYFASQGIKLNQEAQSNDKLGKQLKSFTEWLKTMRRLPQSVAEEVLEKINDVEVVQFAADSLEEKEVLTEAMAEVFVKQEKFARARDVYTKLSLLHPHKNAYFAAKIEELKQ